MNHGYEYDVNVVPPGKIIREITFVEPGACGVPSRRQIMCQIIDTLDSMTRDALVELGWTPPMPPKPPPPPMPPKTCPVKGCTNTSAQGMFVDGLCMPCYDMVVTGRVGNGHTFIHSMRERLDHIAKIAT